VDQIQLSKEVIMSKNEQRPVSFDGRRTFIRATGLVGVAASLGVLAGEEFSQQNKVLATLQAGSNQQRACSR
jgi:hypothetical protein